MVAPREARRKGRHGRMGEGGWRGGTTPLAVSGDPPALRLHEGSRAPVTTDGPSTSATDERVAAPSGDAGAPRVAPASGADVSDPRGDGPRSGSPVRLAASDRCAVAAARTAARRAPGARVLVVGAGVGGLATALRLAAAGARVTLLERHAWLGGKMRAVASPAGPVDAGPTVLTMRGVLEDLFAAAGARLADHVTLHPEPILARHVWPDGTTLDLHADPEATARAIREALGPRAEAEHRAQAAAARRLFEAFEGPMMRAATPSQARLAARVAASPRLLADMAPGRTLAGALARRIEDPRLRQLHGRYATYVGGSPHEAPALLGLISHAEAMGVWRVEGGMARLAEALAALARSLGVEIRTRAHVAEVAVEGARAAGVVLAGGERLAADAVVHAGDPRALAAGLLGERARAAVPPPGRPSLSARVWSFAARAQGVPLAHHTVLFSGDDAAEFAAFAASRSPDDPTLYVCAQDRAGVPDRAAGAGGAGALGRSGDRDPAAPERFEVILNAPPGATADPEEDARCHETMLRTLRARGLRLDPEPGPGPGPEAMTTPAGFAAMFPGSEGALYGEAPDGLTAGLRRPRARTRIPGLYLAGGGAHPGAGVPMAALSGRHAAEAITRDLASTSRSRLRATRGGISTRWRTGRRSGASTS